MTDKELREIDAKIAEELLGVNVQWERGRYGNKHPTMPNEEWAIPCDGPPYHTRLEYGDYGYLNALPAYTFEIQDVMRDVIRAMFQDGWMIDIRGSESGGWSAEFSCTAGARGRYSSNGQTLAWAICFAALDAIKRWPIPKEQRLKYRPPHPYEE